MNLDEIYKKIPSQEIRAIDLMIICLTSTNSIFKLHYLSTGKQGGITISRIAEE